MQYLFKKNIGARKDQQDSVNIIQNGDDILLVLADGMGGHTGGARASNIFISVAQNHFENKSYNDPKKFFEDIVYEAENQIDDFAQESGEDPHTTATLTLIKGGIVYFANIGDSRIYIFTRDGLAIRTRDHSVPEMLLQMGEITEDEMATHPDQNKLTKSVGPDSHEKISYYEYKLESQKEFIVLVCSDGFWEYVNESEMMYWIYGFKLEEALNKMIEIARLKGGEKGDNISVAVVTNRIIRQTSNKADKTSNNSTSKKSNFKLIIFFILFIISIIVSMYYLKLINTKSSTSKNQTQKKESNIQKSSIKQKAIKQVNLKTKK